MPGIRSVRIWTDHAPDRSIPVTGRPARSAKGAFTWLRALTRQLPTRKHEAALRIAIRLVDHFNGTTGRCNPSIETLANGANLSRRGADKGLHDLRELGWIASQGGGGRGRQSQYVLLLDHVETTHADARFEDETTHHRALNHAPPRSKPRTSVRDKDENPENPEDNPPTPLRGEGVVVELKLEADLAELAAAYPIPITNPSKTRTAMEALSPHRRRQVVTAARAYRAFLDDCTRAGKQRAARDCHRWIAGGEWQGFVTSAAKPPERPHVAPNDPGLRPNEWRKALEGWRISRKWKPAAWGPDPTQPRCFAPKELMEEVGVPIPTFDEAA
jgi:hypothetical protein